MKIRFFTTPGRDAYVETEIPDMDDVSVEAARSKVEAVHRLVLPVSPRTDFPQFVILDEEGNEMGGG